MTVFGERDFKEINKLNEAISMGTTELMFLKEKEEVPELIRARLLSLPLSLPISMLTHRAKVMQAHCKKVAIYKTGRKVSSEINHANAFIVDFKPPEL